jgi:Pseudouridylate synthases, 23S RNA-specific
LTQSYIEKNIRKKNILVNNLKSSSNYLLNKNDVVKILNFHPESYKNKVKYKKKIIIEEKDLKLFKKSIIFENQNFIILNKWSGISTQGRK